MTTYFDASKVQEENAHMEKRSMQSVFEGSINQSATVFSKREEFVTIGSSAQEFVYHFPVIHIWHRKATTPPDLRF